MSLFRHVSAWGLRALALWAGIELGVSFYDRATDVGTVLMQLSGHRAAMARLEERARIVANQASALEARLAAVTPAFAISSASPEAAAAAMRQNLIELGAQAPVVEAGPELRSNARSGPLTISASWREPRETAPHVFYGMAERFPGLGVTSLTLETHDQLVHTQATFSAAISPPAGASP